MLVLLAGASGFLGTALRERLDELGHETIQLVRSTPRSASQIEWDPYSGKVDSALIERVDAVVNLAGAPIGRLPWTSPYKRMLKASRVAPTGALARAIASSERKPALVNASGIGYYGAERGTELIDEASTPVNDSYFAEVAGAWEAATAPASAAGARVVIARNAVVLDKDGGALKLIALPFKFGVGGRIGDGKQYFPTISLEDWLSAMMLLITDESTSGAYNLIAPVPATNEEFTKAMGKQLHRPTLIAVPSFAIKTGLGELSDQIVGSIRAMPQRLLDAGFKFEHPTIAEQVDSALS